MFQYSYVLDDELHVIENPVYRELGVSRSVRAPSEALQNHVNAVREFRDGMEVLLSDFMEEIDRQEKEVSGQIDHGEFFLKEFRGNQWNANPMFDRLRLFYVSNLDALKRERRQLKKERIKHKMAFMKELLEANKELSPFSSLF